MAMFRWMMLGAVVPLMVGCGGKSSDDDREAFGFSAGFGDVRLILGTTTVIRSNQSCLEADNNGDLVEPLNILNTELEITSVPVVAKWVSNALENQRVEVTGEGFKASFYKEGESGGSDTLIWNTYQDAWAPNTGVDADAIAAIQADTSLSEQEKSDAIAVVSEKTCYKPENDADESAFTVIDIPQSERLPPINAADWPTPPEVANQGMPSFNGWSEDGTIGPLAGEYYVIIEATINLPGQPMPDSIRRDFTILE
ncbi:MAG: hypothetical protein COA99_03610 [Moraxellaceae bacterium]|nr:MAG: hypothetical protein COA99_03610 [Moraxellaceae bacterium]